MQIIKPQVTLSHSGKQHAYQVARCLNNLHCLDMFYTSSYIKNKKIQNCLLQKGDTFWTRRFIEGLAGNKIDSNWRFEIKEFVLRKIYGKSPKVQQAVYERDMSFDNYVSKQILKRKSDVFWGFQGSCFLSLEAAKKSGKTSICELATAHVVAAKRILGEESKLNPEWADSIDNLVFPAIYEKRLTEEPHRADFCIAASGFTKQTLIEAGIDHNKIIYMPLGFDASKINFVPNENKITNRKLKLLYAGTVTQRKGIKYLLEAMKLIGNKDVELDIIGGIQGGGDALKTYAGVYNYHAPISQAELFVQYKNYDALVLPTIFEGFGLVIVEAMAAGVPVITTNHSIGAELIENDKNGYLIPIRNVDAIAKSIENLRNKNNNEYLAMQNAARQTAENFSWASYEKNLDKLLTNLIK